MCVEVIVCYIIVVFLRHSVERILLTRRPNIDASRVTIIVAFLLTNSELYN